MEKTLKSPKPKLRIDWATHEAAKYACEKWHYSKCVPQGSTVKFGVYEDDKFIGAVIFSHGANKLIGSPFGLLQHDVVELARVALTRHQTEVSKIVSICIRKIKAKLPSTKLIISYADPEQGHTGSIYQAMNWIYLGPNKGASYKVVLPNGDIVHPRVANHKLGTEKGLKKIRTMKKHTYAFPLTKGLGLISKPYPKRASSVESGTSPDQGERGGESPTDALQLNRDAV